MNNYTSFIIDISNILDKIYSLYIYIYIYIYNGVYNKNI